MDRSFALPVLVNHLTLRLALRLMGQSLLEMLQCQLMMALVVEMQRLCWMPVFTIQRFMIRTDVRRRYRRRR